MPTMQPCTKVSGIVKAIKGDKVKNKGKKQSKK